MREPPVPMKGGRLPYLMLTYLAEWINHVARPRSELGWGMQVMKNAICIGMKNPDQFVQCKRVMLNFPNRNALPDDSFGSVENAKMLQLTYHDSRKIPSFRANRIRM